MLGPSHDTSADIAWVYGYSRIVYLSGGAQITKASRYYSWFLFHHIRRTMCIRRTAPSHEITTVLLPPSPVFWYWKRWYWKRWPLCLLRVRRRPPEGIDAYGLQFVRLSLRLQLAPSEHFPTWGYEKLSLDRFLALRRSHPQYHA